MAIGEINATVAVIRMLCVMNEKMQNQKFKLGFYNVYQLLLKVVVIISVFPIFMWILILTDNVNFISDLSPALFISSMILFPMLLIFIWLKPFSYIDKIQISKDGIYGDKNELIKWIDIKSFDWKYAYKGGGHYIKLKLLNGKVFHLTTQSKFKNNLILFYRKFIELKPNELNIKMTFKPYNLD